jgi:hypothetical protein
MEDDHWPSYNWPSYRDKRERNKPFARIRRHWIPKSLERSLEFYQSAATNPRLAHQKLLTRLNTTFDANELNDFIGVYSTDQYVGTDSVLGKATQDSLLQILGEPLHKLADSWAFLMIARYQYHTTRNPLWPWMVFGIYSRARLLPPSWVWEYFLTAAVFVSKGAAALRPFNELRDKTANYSGQKFTKVLELTKTRGKRDHFTEFRQVITEFRLALRVRNLAFPDKGAKTGLMKACGLVSDAARTERRRLTKREREAERRQVWKAYNRWFEKNGRFRFIPTPR